MAESGKCARLESNGSDVEDGLTLKMMMDKEVNRRKSGVPLERLGSNPNLGVRKFII